MYFVLVINVSYLQYYALKRITTVSKKYCWTSWGGGVASEDRQMMLWQRLCQHGFGRCRCISPALPASACLTASAVSPLGPGGNTRCGVRHTIYRLHCKPDGIKRFVQGKLLLLLNVTRHGQGGIVSCYQKCPWVADEQLQVFIAFQKRIQYFEIIRKFVPLVIFFFLQLEHLWILSVLT